MFNVASTRHVVRALMSAAMLAVGISFLSGCAKKVPEPEFRPMQIRWTAAPGQDENSMPGKDLCVIKITARLMGEAPVRASAVEEIFYNVEFGINSQNAGTLDFTGVCADPEDVNRPECRWSATCDDQGNVVVKFNNGD